MSSHSSQSFLTTLPFWIWPILLTIVIALIVFAATRDQLKALFTAAVGALLTSVLMLIHYFDVYLNNHFVATFDETGLPTDFTRSGFSLLIDAWPIWLVPSLLIAAILLVGFYWHQIQTRIFPSKIVSKSPDNLGEYIEDQAISSRIPNSKNVVADKLEIEKLKHKLAVAEEKFRVIKDQQSSKGRSSKAADKYIEELRQARLDLGKERKEAEVLRQQIKNHEEDLDRANSLIDRLLNEKFGADEDK